MVTGKNNPNSILNIITLARENARGVQEHITKDLWQCLNEYYHTVKDTKLENALTTGRPDQCAGCFDQTGNAVLWYGRDHHGARRRAAAL